MIIEADAIVIEESEVDSEMLTRLLPKLDYPAVLQAVQQVAELCEKEGFVVPELPKELPENIDSSLVSNLHKLLFDVHLIEGHLVCPDTGRKFPVKEGIPNMILHEDEI